MPTYEVLPRFAADLDRLTPEQRRKFRQTVAAFGKLNVLVNNAANDDRHAIAEHKEIDDLLADLAARDMASPGWIRRFAALREEYLHHIREEEQEQFVAAEEVLSLADRRFMRTVFNRRKQEEKAAAEVEKKIRLKA